MRQINTVMLAWLMSFVLLSCFVCKAETKVPCLIFSGNAEKDYLIDLAKFNRITFCDNSMVVSSSKDESIQSVELLYSLYNRLKIGEANPEDIENGVETIYSDSDSRIYVDGQAKLLCLESSTDEQFSVGIFSISGSLLLTTDLRPGDAVSLEALSPGVYIAVLSNGQTDINLKFILY